MTSFIPTLIGKLGHRRQIKVWCMHCKNYHFHEFPEGHRAAHCTNLNSPYCETGYFIKLGKNL